MFLLFRKNKETKCLSVQILKKFKRDAVSLSKMCRSKIFEVVEITSNSRNPLQDF